VSIPYKKPCFSPAPPRFWSGSAAYALAAGQPRCFFRRCASDVSARRGAQLVRAARAGEGSLVTMGSARGAGDDENLLLENHGKPWEIM